MNSFFDAGHRLWQRCFCNAFAVVCCAAHNALKCCDTLISEPTLDWRQLNPSPYLRWEKSRPATTVGSIDLATIPLWKMPECFEPLLYLCLDRRRNLLASWSLTDDSGSAAMQHAQLALRNSPFKQPSAVHEHDEQKSVFMRWCGLGYDKACRLSAMT